MKVFVNKAGELAIGEFVLLIHNMWRMFNGYETYYTVATPEEWGWEYLSEL
jgi:hypothetical protein